MSDAAEQAAGGVLRGGERFLGRLGAWLRKERQRLGMKQSELAGAIGGISDSSISSWERGDKEMGAGDYLRLCEFFRRQDPRLVGTEAQTRKQSGKVEASRP